MIPLIDHERGLGQAIRHALERGKPADEIAHELSISPRHVRRLARAAGWVGRRGPKPTGQRPRVTCRVDAETLAALEARAERAGCTVAQVAARLLTLVADADRLQRVLDAAEAARKDPGRGPHYACGSLSGVLDALT